MSIRLCFDFALRASSIRNEEAFFKTANQGACHFRGSTLSAKQSRGKDGEKRA